MSKPKSMLVTSEMMQNGVEPLLFTGGAANILTESGSIRNTGRDPLARWLDEMGWSYFDPQIHPSTHGRDYNWGLDAPQEKKAREIARLRVYEITATTIAAVSILEIMDDARRNRKSIVWFDNGKDFAPLGIGSLEKWQNEETRLKQKLGQMPYEHLLAYLKAGRHLRKELPILLADCPTIVFVDSFDELKAAISFLLKP